MEHIEATMELQLRDVLLDDDYNPLGKVTFMEWDGVTLTVGLDKDPKKRHHYRDGEYVAVERA